MLVYIAGPMRGVEKYNAPLFEEAEKDLRAFGFDVINPHKLDKEAGFDVYALPEGHDWSSTPEGFDMDECIRRDIDAVLKADAICMLKGYDRSTGATAELSVAMWAGKKLIEKNDRGLMLWT